MGLYRFSWVIEGELAAMARPDGSQEDLADLKASGIGALVNLTDWDWPPEALRESGLSYLRLPVPDFAPPEPQQVEAFVAFCRQSIERGRPVAVHCLAGRGRSGTMAACYLVSRGMTAQDAVLMVRALRPGSIETPSQERAVHEFAARRDADGS